MKPETKETLDDLYFYAIYGPSMMKWLETNAKDLFDYYGFVPISPDQYYKYRRELCLKTDEMITDPICFKGYKLKIIED